MDNIHDEMQEPEHDLWRIVEEQYRNGELLKARVIDYNKGGLIVDVAGIRGFVPISQILNLKPEEVAAGGEGQETAARLQGMKNKELQLKIIEINRVRNRLILSERLAVQESRQRRRDELLDELNPGEIRRGVVSNVANFGAFVDLGGADGLVPMSELTWSNINHPSQVLHIGQQVEVQVLSVDKEKKKIMLSIKRTVVNICPSCKREVQSNWKHCMYCGSSLAKVCPRCGAPCVDVEGARFCFECGSPFE